MGQKFLSYLPLQGLCRFVQFSLVPWWPPPMPTTIHPSSVANHLYTLLRPNIAPNLRIFQLAGQSVSVRRVSQHFAIPKRVAVPMACFPLHIRDAVKEQRSAQTDRTGTVPNFFDIRAMHRAKPNSVGVHWPNNPLTFSSHCPEKDYDQWTVPRWQQRAQTVDVCRQSIRWPRKRCPLAGEN